MDKISLQRIETLHPVIRKEAQEILRDCTLALSGRAYPRITQALRTFKEQDALYQQGRTKPGKKVTNAKAGQSIHNYGLAVDICLIIDNKIASWDTAKDWDNDRIADWYECVKIFAKYGWNWGGSWLKFRDLPHFEKRVITVKGKETPCTWRNLINLELDKNGYIAT